MKKIALSIAALVLSGAAFPTMVLAQAAPVPDFATLDTDKSGEVSYSELLIALPNISQDQFNSADADKSGGLSANELTSITAAGTGSLTQQPPSNTKPDNSNNTPGQTNGGTSGGSSGSN